MINLAHQPDNNHVHISGMANVQLVLDKSARVRRTSIDTDTYANPTFVAQSPCASDCLLFMLC
jgi:hypothetical protein